MSPCYWKDSAVNLFPRRHFRIPLQCFLEVNGQGLLFPETSAGQILKFHVHSVCFKNNPTAFIRIRAYV